MLNPISSTASITPAASKPQYLENLSAICTSSVEGDVNYGKYTKQQIDDACEKRNAREYAAFGHFAGDASPQGIKKLAEAYIKYIDQLSPEEQNTDCYRGTKESAKNLLSAVNAQISSGTNESKPVKDDSLLGMLFDRMKKQLKDNALYAPLAAKTSYNDERVSISNAARALAAGD